MPRPLIVQTPPRPIALGLLAVTLGSGSRAGAADAPRVALFGGYAYAVRGDDPELEPGRARLHGFEASVDWNLGSHLGVMADASAHSGPLAGAELRRAYLLAGARVSFRGRALTLFIHALLGAVRTRESLTVADLIIQETATALGGAAGGGIDLSLGARWALRFQGDLTLVKSDEEITRAPRFAAGLVFRGGRRK